MGNPRLESLRVTSVDDRRQRDHPSEMPRGDQSGRMHGFQLWANLPRRLKMTPPRIKESKRRYSVVTDDDGTQVRLVCGTFWGKD